MLNINFNCIPAYALPRMFSGFWKFDYWFSLLYDENYDACFATRDSVVHFTFYAIFLSSRIRIRIFFYTIRLLNLLLFVKSCFAPQCNLYSEKTTGHSQRFSTNLTDKFCVSKFAKDNEKHDIRRRSSRKTTTIIYKILFCTAIWSLLQLRTHGAVSVSKLQNRTPVIDIFSLSLSLQKKIILKNLQCEIRQHNFYDRRILVSVNTWKKQRKKADQNVSKKCPGAIQYEIFSAWNKCNFETNVIKEWSPCCF